MKVLRPHTSEDWNVWPRGLLSISNLCDVEVSSLQGVKYGETANDPRSHAYTCHQHFQQWPQALWTMNKILTVQSFSSVYFTFLTIAMPLLLTYDLHVRLVGLRCDEYSILNFYSNSF